MAASRQECSICMDSFKNPRLISCHHSFCYKCLEDYIRVNLCNGRFNCPICRTSVELPKNGVSAFQRNFYIDSDSDETFICDLCGPNHVACSRCLDCEENLCQSCCHAHEKSKVSRHHKICDLGTLDSEMKGKIRQRMFCDQHPEEEIKLVCQDCKVPICFMCKAIKHDNHSTKAIADVATEVKKTLDTKLNQCSDKLRRIKASTAKGDELDKNINDAEREELKAVDDHCSQLHKAIDQEGAKVKEKIKSVYHLLRQQNAVFKRDIGDEFSTCSNIKDKAQKLRDQGTDMEIIKTGPNIEQAMSAAILKTDQTPTTRLDNKLFSPAKINASMLIPLIGMMEDSTDAEERKKKEMEERKKKEMEERKKKEMKEREKKEREEREKKEREEKARKEREEREKKEREERAKKEREEKARKEREEREKKERDEGEKKEREEKQIQAYRLEYPKSWRSVLDEDIKTLMCPGCQGWLPGYCILLSARCQCGAKK